MKISFKHQLIDFRFYSLILIAFFMPINQKTTTICILFSVLLLLIDFKVVIKKISFLKMYIPLFILFILYVISSYRDFYTLNIKMVEQKLSLLVFPLIIFSVNIKKEQIIKILKYFVYGCFASYILLLLNAFYSSIDFGTFTFNPYPTDFTNKHANYFIYHNFLGKQFSNGFHGTYLSMYFLFSIVIITIFKNEFSNKIRYIFYTCFIALIFQVSSVFNLIFLALIIFNFSNKLAKLIMVFVFLAAFFLNLEKTVDIIKSENRITIWKSTLEVIKKSPITGFGMKTAQRKLHNQFPKTGTFGANVQKTKIDTHNQFFQLTLETGVLGLLLLLLVYYHLIKRITIESIEIKTVTIWFLLLIFFLSLLESTFNRFVGLSFFTFFYTLFISFYRKNINKRCQYT